LSAFAEIAVGRAVVLGLSAARAAGLVAVSPWPGKSAPAYARGALAFALGASALSLDLVPEGATSFAPPLGGPWWTGLALGCAAEVGCGLLMGFVVRLAFSAVDVLGSALSYALGLSTPVVPDPESGATEPPVARALSLGALALALSAGVHRDLLARLLASYRALPPGAPLRLIASVPDLVDFAGMSIAAGVSLSLPFVAAALAVQIVLALVGRAAPSLQLFSVGFTLLTLAGLSMLTSALEGLCARLLAHLGQAGAWIDAVLTTAAGG
jgi:flagellar biosynthetic protein FliR